MLTVGCAILLNPDKCIYKTICQNGVTMAYWQCSCEIGNTAACWLCKSVQMLPSALRIGTTHCQGVVKLINFMSRAARKLLDAVLQLMDSLMQRIWNIILDVHLELLH